MSAFSRRVGRPLEPPTPEQQAEAIAENRRTALEIKRILDESRQRSAVERAVGSLMERLPSPDQQKPSDLN